MLHKDYRQTIRGEDGAKPMEAIRCPPQPDVDLYYYSGLSTDLTNTTSVPRRSRGSPWPAFGIPPCKSLRGDVNHPQQGEHQKIGPAYGHPNPRMGSSPTPEPAYGALNRPVEQLAKLSSGSKNAHVTAPSEAVRAKLGITEPLTKPAMASLSPVLTSLADDL